MKDRARRWLGGDGYKYALLDGQTRSDLPLYNAKKKPFILVVMLILLAAFAGAVVSGSLTGSSGHGRAHGSKSCDHVYKGYQCKPEISHFWGQYSPFFTVPSTIPDVVPPTCKITFAQILSRHGDRDPTASKTTAYNATVQKLQTNVKEFTGPYAFLASYEYTLGADQLTGFGQQSMINSGIKYYNRYESLSRDTTPFVRSSGEARVVESAQNWTQGFHAAKLDDRRTAHHDSAYPYSILTISEATGSNNTLNHGLCTNFENGPDIAGAAQKTWSGIFIPPIQARLNAGMPGANLSVTETIYMMDLCPFNTVASPTGSISQFCDLFTEREWHQYAYYETLNKYYGYGPGNPLGPTQGVGFVNELIARLTGKPVQDATSTNHTLDSNPATFPLGSKLYADFSHDNDMTAAFSALGLYHAAAPLSNTSVTEAPQAHGYSAAWTVPFSARAYVEKMECLGQREELVRVIINDRVQPLKQCGGDGLGRCKLSRFVDSLGFARGNGEWEKCFS